MPWCHLWTIRAALRLRKPVCDNDLCYFIESMVLWYFWISLIDIPVAMLLDYDLQPIHLSLTGRHSTGQIVSAAILFHRIKCYWWRYTEFQIITTLLSRWDIWMAKPGPSNTPHWQVYEDWNDISVPRFSVMLHWQMKLGWYQRLFLILPIIFIPRIVPLSEKKNKFSTAVMNTLYK